MKKKGVTAAELMASLKNDPAFLAARAKEEQERQGELALLEAEYADFARDCFLVGYSLKTAWDLVQTDKPYPELIPILVKHLREENHSAKFREGIARALASPESSKYFAEIFSLFVAAKEQPPTVRWAIACALSVAAQDQQDLDTLEGLLLDKKIGQDRNALLQAVKRMPKEQRERVLSFAREDAELKINLGVYKLR
jgi:hypothetical protein